VSTIDVQRRVRKETHATLGDLAAELERLQASKVDYVVDTRRMSFSTVTAAGAAITEGGDARGSYLTFDTPDGTAGGVVNDHAHTQIGLRLQIPKAYYDRMRNDAPALLDRNVEHWLHQRAEKRMVRMLDGDVRAFLSNRYRRLDNYDLMEQSIIPALQHVQGLSFHVAALTPERMTVRALLPSLTREVRVGDVVQAGVQIRNSEVGAGALDVRPFVWRLICKNGMVSDVGAKRQQHVGRRAEEDDHGIYRDETLRADDVAFFLATRDAIAAALTDTQFDLIVAQMQGAANGTRVESPVAATEQLASTYQLTDGERDGVLAHLASGGDLSQWGLVNAVTAAAKDAVTFERQQEMERIGGQVLALPTREWTRTLAAA
jgi:hypothetical protein